jgi:tetratricopeptide (TPR) repeat protein
MLTIKNPQRNHPDCKSFNPFTLLNLCFLLFIFCGCTPAGPKAFIQGAKLIDKGKYTEAVEQLKLATSLIPTNAQAWNYLALAYHHAGQLDEAEKTYRRALLIDHDLSEAHYNLGCLFLEERKNDAAKTEFIAYTLRRANSLDALLKLGSAQLRLGELAAAEKSFQDALRLSPQNAETLNGLGCVRAHQRAHINEAPGYFRAALKAQTNYPPAILNWAIFAQQSQDKRFALQKYREYVSLRPPPENVPAVKAVAAQLEQELNPPPAAHVVTNASPPRVAPTNVTRPAAVQKSEPATTSAKSVTPPVPRTATNNTRPLAVAAPPPLPADADVVKLQPEPVVKPAQDISAAPTPTASAPGPATPSSDGANATSAIHAQAECLFAEGRRAQQAHRLADAINSYRAATEQDPAYFEAFYNLALTTGETGDSQAALAAYESALAIRPDSIEARYNLSLVLKQNNDFARAASELERLLQKYPNDTRSHLALGNLYAQQLHEPAKARQHYLKVLETDPHNAQADKIRFWLTSNP